MLINILHAFQFVIIAIWIISVIIAILFIGMNLELTWVHNMRDRAKEAKKAKLRKAKEDSAHEGFFEESYVRGFDARGALIHRGVKVPTAKALEYYRKMDLLADTQIFMNTEEI